MAFEGLTEKISAAFKKLRGKGRLKESDVKEAMREVKLALLEADVNFKVVREFISKVTERAVGSEVLESLMPASGASVARSSIMRSRKAKNPPIPSFRISTICLLRSRGCKRSVVSFSENLKG